MDSAYTFTTKRDRDDNSKKNKICQGNAPRFPRISTYFEYFFCSVFNRIMQKKNGQFLSYNLAWTKERRSEMVKSFVKFLVEIREIIKQQFSLYLHMVLPMPGLSSPSPYMLHNEASLSNWIGIWRLELLTHIPTQSLKFYTWTTLSKNRTKVMKKDRQWRLLYLYVGLSRSINSHTNWDLIIKLTFIFCKHAKIAYSFMSCHVTMSSRQHTHCLQTNTNL